MTTLTREALYELVWTSPTRVVAEKFGVSDVWLKKVCAKAGIPTPDRGYWAKAAAGKPIVKARLPLREPGMPNEVVITKATYNWRYDPAAELAEPIPEPPSFPEPLAAVRDRIVKRLGKVLRSRDLALPGPMVRKLLAADEKRRERQRQSAYPSTWDAPLFESPFEIRRLKVLNAIELALARVGGRLDYSGNEARSLTVKVGEQVMVLELDHPTAKANRWGQWSTRPGPVDILRLELKARHTEGPGKLVWIDGKGGKLEDNLTEIVVTLAYSGEVQYRRSLLAHHAYLLKRRADNEAEVAKRRAEAELQARERRLKAQQERRERLFGQAKDWRAAQDIREFVSRVLASRDDTPNELQAWAAWALAEADTLDPTLNGSLEQMDVVPTHDA